MRELIRSLPERAGRGSVRGTLEAVARAALAARLEASAGALPSGSAPAGADPDGAALLEARVALAAYLRAEQRLGRVRAGCDPEPVAGLLLDACERRALNLRVLGDSALGTAGGFAAELARTLTRTLEPPAP